MKSIGYVHLIRTDTEYPEIEAFEIRRCFRKCGYGEKLILSIPEFLDPLKEIHVKPHGTDVEYTSNEEVKIIYGNISDKLNINYNIRIIQIPK